MRNKKRAILQGRGEIKKYSISLIFASLLFGSVSALGADITDVDELFAAAGTGGTYTIAGGDYDLSLKSGGGADLDITNDFILIPTGDVVIDGNDLYRTVIRNYNATIGDSSNTYRITFTDPNGHTMTVYNSAKSVQATFYYCDFSDANNGNCFSVNSLSGSGYELNVNCYDCRAYGATGTNRDGYNCTSDGANGVINLTLDNCEAYNNADDGVTAHDVNTTVRIIDGKYHNNTFGIQFVGGAILKITGNTEVYSNSLYGVHHAGNGGGIARLQGDISIRDNTFNLVLGGSIHAFVEGCELYNSTNGDIIRIDGSASLTIRNCNLYDPNDSKWALLHNSSGPLAVDGCVFYSTGSTTSAGGIYISSAIGAAITNSIIYGFQSGPAISTENNCKAIIDHCTIYDCAYGIEIENVAAISNSILAEVDNHAISCPSSPSTYYSDGGGGYNYFYNNGTNFYQVGSAQENDIEAAVPPGFIDAANSDFRLEPNSPCLNAGSETPGKGLTKKGWSSIGAWQGMNRSIILPTNCTEWLEMDFNNDCKVDFQDFALFSLSWLDCNLDPQEACWE